MRNITQLLALLTTQWLFTGENLRFCHQEVVYKPLRKELITISNYHFEGVSSITVSFQELMNVIL